MEVVSHACTHLGFLEGPEMQGRTRHVADGCKVLKAGRKFGVYFNLLAIIFSGLPV